MSSPAPEGTRPSTSPLTECFSRISLSVRSASMDDESLREHKLAILDFLHVIAAAAVATALGHKGVPEWICYLLVLTAVGWKLWLRVLR
jgi:hypothetical protein